MARSETEAAWSCQGLVASASKSAAAGRAATHSRTPLQAACASSSRPRMARGATWRRCCSSPWSSREAATRKATAPLQPKPAYAHAPMPPALQVVMIVDAFFFEKVVANDSIRVLALGSAEAYAAALADPEARWRKPVTLVHAWLDRLKEHYEVRRSRACAGQQSACASRRSRSQPPRTAPGAPVLRGAQGNRDCGPQPGHRGEAHRGASAPEQRAPRCTHTSIGAGDQARALRHGGAAAVDPALQGRRNKLPHRNAVQGGVPAVAQERSIQDAGRHDRLRLLPAAERLPVRASSSGRAALSSVDSPCNQERAGPAASQARVPPLVSVQR